MHLRRLERYAKMHPPTHLIGRAFIKLRDDDAPSSSSSERSGDLAVLLGAAPDQIRGAKA